jgi:hypothetical protein
MINGRNIYGSVKGAYSGANQQFAGPSPARCARRTRFLGIYTRRDGHEFSRRSLAPQSHQLVQQRLPGQARLSADRRRYDPITGGFTQGAQSSRLSGVGNFSSLFARIFDE